MGAHPQHEAYHAACQAVEEKAKAIGLNGARHKDHNDHFVLNAQQPVMNCFIQDKLDEEVVRESIEYIHRHRNPILASKEGVDAYHHYFETHSVTEAEGDTVRFRGADSRQHTVPIAKLEEAIKMELAFAGLEVLARHAGITVDLPATPRTPT